MSRVLLLLLFVSCKGGHPFHEMDFTWSRMMAQPRGTAFGSTPVFADGMVMRTPPRGTLAMESHETVGKEADGGWVDVLPGWVTRDSIDEGRARFEQFCAPCHGLLGDGQGPVAPKMLLRKPPSYTDPRIVSISPGEIHDVIRDGYGLMPSYASKLDDEERWEVVAYVLALRRSQHTRASELTSDMRDELGKEEAP